MNSVKPEKLKAAEHAETKKAVSERTEISETKAVQEGASRIIDTAGIESAEGKDAGLELSEGKVSEIAAEQRKKAASSGIPVTRTADEVEAIRAKLLQNLPPAEVMVAQIKQSLRCDQKQLQKHFKKAKKMGDKAAFQLNIIVAQLRKIREYLAMLANATFEILKQLWLKIVHRV